MIARNRPGVIMAALDSKSAFLAFRQEELMTFMVSSERHRTSSFLRPKPAEHALIVVPGT